jgi:hypothetical protein
MALWVELPSVQIGWPTVVTCYKSLSCLCDTFFCRRYHNTEALLVSISLITLSCLSQLFSLTEGQCIDFWSVLIESSGPYRGNWLIVVCKFLMCHNGRYYMLVCLVNLHA